MDLTKAYISTQNGSHSESTNDPIYCLLFILTVILTRGTRINEIIELF